MKTKISSDYLQKVFYPDEFSKMIREATRNIKAFSQKTSFEALAFTGVSGASIAFPLSITLKKPLICLRKSEDRSHYVSCRDSRDKARIEGCLSAKTYLFVDDCIASGDTARDLFKTLEKELRAKPVGIYLFDQNSIGDNFRTDLVKGPKKIPVIVSKHPWSLIKIERGMV